MDFSSVVGQIKELEQQIEDGKIDSRFEERKLYNYLDDYLVDLFEKYNVIVAGGMITSLFTKNDINDVDVYFRSEHDLTKFIERLYKDDLHIISATKKAVLFQKHESHREPINIQAIHFNYFNSAEELFDTFDFTVCMGAYDFKTGQFTFNRNFFKHNAQKVLEFNKNTAYPLMSLIRIGKYESKGYTISTPELMRIILTCMSLDINSYDELKEQLGGMYGINVDKLFQEGENEEFSLDNAIDKLQDLNLDDEYFTKPEPFNFDDVDELLSVMIDKPIKCFWHNNILHKISHTGKLKEADTHDEDKLDKNEYVEIKKEDYFNTQDNKFYKFVKKNNDGKYVSNYNPNFEYKLNEVIEAENSAGLFFYEFDDLINAKYIHEDESVLIEVEVDPDDFNGFKNDHITLKRCKMLREVPEEEYEDEIN